MTDAVTAELTVSGVHQTFITTDGKPMNVLNNINLNFDEEKFVSIVGHSGCGKSTLLRIVSGLQRPTRGSVRFKGHEVTGPGADRGMVFQQDAVFPWLTVRRNIEFGMEARGVAREEIGRQSKRWIELVGLTGWEDAYPKELSGGMRKRVDLARVYANSPEVMLMDEPFGALDQQTKSVMQGELLRLWQNSRSIVLFVTHDLEEAIYLSDEIVVLAPRPGRVKSKMQVSLARPREDGMRLTTEFLEQKRALHELLKESL